MQEYLKNFNNCLQNEAPYCMATCPFYMNIPEFVDKMKRGAFKAAFKIYQNAAGYPLIASNLCHEPCKKVCPLKDVNGSIELGKLESACLLFTEDKSPTSYNLPMKNKKIAVIGAGISGLACVLRLCMKKYHVEIFEASDRIGGHLWQIMDPEVFMSDITEQLKHEEYILHLNQRIEKVEDLNEGKFDAVYVATGENGTDFGLLDDTKSTGDRYCFQYENAGWFAGGGLIGDQGVYVLSRGLYMGTVIDNYLKTGNLLYPSNLQEIKMQLDPARLNNIAFKDVSCGDCFNEEEAVHEASRCIRCQCDSCRLYCDLTDFYNKWPLRIRDEIIATTLPGSSEIKATPAKRLISTCNQCGLCVEVCPENVDLGKLILEARRSMHRQNKAPWVFHDFWIRDMEFANSESASLCKAPKAAYRAEDLDNPQCTYAFFPGCQLGASDGDLVRQTYQYLLKKRPDMGLLLRCCGAPAEWSGDQEKHQEEINTIRKLWNSLGNPILILACPTCIIKFKAYIPDIPVVSLYEIIAEWGIGVCDRADRKNQKSQTYSVFDSCAARHEDRIKDSVRTLAQKSGYRLEALKENDAFAKCCGYGGQPAIANPEYTKFVTQKRISESPNPYIVYCINCRDIFVDSGKEAVHILDILFRNAETMRSLPTISQRRENRIRLKELLLKEFWGESLPLVLKKCEIKIMISDGLSQKLSRQRILEEDICKVIDFCERTGRKIYHPEASSFSGYCEIGFMTCWVEYRDRSETGAFEILNAYSHRMKIKMEEVWNGKRANY